MAPVCRDDPITGFQGCGYADRNRLLTEAQMYRPLDEAGTAQLKTPFLEMPDDTHTAVEVQHVRFPAHHKYRSRMSLWVVARA